jgi:peptidoglycan/xylan/chitin deacetylase (PgdA/CDA1 family)
MTNFRPAVKISVPNVPEQNGEKVRYALQLISVYLGIRLETVETAADLVFEEPDFDSWSKSAVKLAHVDRIPLLYTKKKPDFIIQEGRIGFDIIGAIFWLLSRREETESSWRDQWGNFTPAMSVLKELGLLQTPVVNYWIQAIANYIEQQLGIRRLPAWKNGMRFAVCLTHDVDLVTLDSVKEKFRAYELLRNGLAGTRTKFNIVVSPLYAVLKRCRDLTLTNPCWRLEKWLRLEERYNVRSTFFFFSETVHKRHYVDAWYRYDDKIVFDDHIMTAGEMIREIAMGGWEVGLHGSYSTSEEISELREQKERLERVLCHDVKSIRHHFLRFDAKLTPVVHQKTAFESDTTLGFNSDIGFRAGVGYPFKLWDWEQQREASTWEIPLIIQDGALFRKDFLEVATAQQAFDICIRLIDEIEKTEGLITLLWHSHTIADGRYPEWFKAYELLLQYLATRDCWITSVREITDWCEKRREILAA